MSTHRTTTAAVLIVSLAVAACSDDAASTATRPSVVYQTAPSVTLAPDTTGTGDGGTTPPSSTGSPEGKVTVSVVTYGLTSPVDIAWRPDDTTAFVVQQRGQIVPVRDGRVGAPVLDIASELSDGGEQGLLGLAFSRTEPLAYVDYTNTDGDTVIAEFAVGGDGTFDPSSERVLLTIDQPHDNHNGGKVVIGSDGMLYIGMGDGGSGNDPDRRALDPSQLLGKLLRIDPRAAGDKPYGIPADNPFVGVAGARPEIWAVGLRNPWRFHFDSATGDLWIADVGQDRYEEVDVAWAADGAGRAMNFGWSALEATHRVNEDQSTDGTTAPVYEYEHGDLGCAVSGGDVYRGDAIPELRGWYVFGDYCSGRVWALSVAPGGAPTVIEIGKVAAASAVSFGPDGEMYVLDWNTGAIATVTAA